MHVNNSLLKLLHTLHSKSESWVLPWRFLSLQPCFLSCLQEWTLYPWNWWDCWLCCVMCFNKFWWPSFLIWNIILVYNFLQFLFQLVTKSSKVFSKIYSDDFFLWVLVSSLANTFSQLTKTTLELNCFSSHSITLSANEQGVPSESYLQEVQEQLEERREESEENQHQREARSASDNTGLYQWVMQSVFSPIARLMEKTQTLTGHVHSTRLATWLPFLHESPFSSRPDEADWALGLVLVETHPMQWLSLCNT